MSRLLLALVVLPATLVATETKTLALGPIDLDLGLKAGAATKPDSYANNPFGFGVGGRAGISQVGVRF